MFDIVAFYIKEKTINFGDETRTYNFQALCDFRSESVNIRMNCKPHITFKDNNHFYSSLVLEEARGGWVPDI